MVLPGARWQDAERYLVASRTGVIPAESRRQYVRGTDGFADRRQGCVSLNTQSTNPVRCILQDTDCTNSYNIYIRKSDKPMKSNFPVSIEEAAKEGKF